MTACLLMCTGARRKKVEELAAQGATVVIYVSPHNLCTVLSDCAVAFGGDRDCCLGKELTKKFEVFENTIVCALHLARGLWNSIESAAWSLVQDFDRGTLHELNEEYKDIVSKGEVVLVIGPAAKLKMGQEVDMVLASKLLDERLSAGDSVSRAARSVASEMGVGRRQIYQLAMEKEDLMDKQSPDGLCD